MDNEQRRLHLAASLNNLARRTDVAYTRWIQRFLADTYQVQPPHRFDLREIRRDILTAALKPEHLSKWLKALTECGLSSASIAQARSAVLWLANWLVEQQHIPAETNGALINIPAPRLQRVENHTWLNRQQVRALLSAFNADERAAMRARNIAIISLMVLCGLRREEIVQSRWRDLVENKLTVQGKARRQRIITLPALASEALEVWRGFHPMPHGEQYIFTRIMSNGRVSNQKLEGSAILNIVREAGELANLEGLTAHDLRRTFARGAYEAGADYEAVRQALGHVSAGTTQVYIGSAAEAPKSEATQTWARHLEDDRALP